MSHLGENQAALSLNLLSTTIFDSVSSGISIADPRQDECPLLYVNPSFTRITGYRAEAVIGHNCRFLQGPDTDAEGVALVRRAVREGYEASVVLLNYRKDGVAFWNDLRISPVRDSSGQLIFLVGVQNDITERVAALRERDQTASQLNALLSSTGEGIYGIDTHGTFTFVNAAGARMLGGAVDDFVGRDSHGLVHHTRSDGSAYPVEECPIYRAFATGTGCRVDDDFFWRLDGTSFPTDYSSFPIVHDGAITGAVVSFSDISARKAAEAKLRQALTAADEANAAKSRFLATMSHELRTPLNAIIGYSEMLQEEASDAAMPQFVLDTGKITKAGRQLLALINNVLDLSKIEADKAEVFLESSTVAEIVSDVVDTVSPLVEGSGNVLVVEPADAQMHTDVTKVRQSLINLLANANKFTHNGKIMLSVSCFEASSRAFVRFSVQDTGIGIPEAHLERLFEPFDRGDLSLASRYGGTGLGLAITRSFCSLLGGDVSVTSELGRGSIFTMTLPLVVDEERDASLADSTNMRPCVLLVKDRQSSAGIAESLASEDFDTLSLTSVDEAVRLSSERTPAAIIFDAAASEVSVGVALRRLRADCATADIPVVVLVGSDVPDQPVALAPADMLMTPVDAGGLRPLLRRLLAGLGPDVLVVDNDSTTRAMLRSQLERHGLRVVDVSGGDEALRELRRAPPSLVLLDLLMPRTDGFAVIEAMTSESALHLIPIIVVTAKDITADDRRWLDRRVSAVLQKGSYSQEQLLAEIRGRLPAIPSTAADDDGGRV